MQYISGHKYNIPQQFRDTLYSWPWNVSHVPTTHAKCVVGTVTVERLWSTPAVNENGGIYGNSGILQNAWRVRHFVKCLGSLQNAWWVRQFANCLGILQNAWRVRHFANCLGILQNARVFTLPVTYTIIMRHNNIEVAKCGPEDPVQRTSLDPYGSRPVPGNFLTGPTGSYHKLYILHTTHYCKTWSELSECFFAHSSSWVFPIGNRLFYMMQLMIPTSSLY